jgi:hypothetical protein
MRPTLQIDDLLRELKKRAGKEGLTLSELANLGLRQSLGSRKRPRRGFRQKTRDLDRPSLDVTKANAVAAELDERLRRISGHFEVR